MSRTLILLSFLLTVCLISKSDASEKHGDVMARPRLLLTTTTRKNISSEYSSTSHDQTVTGSSIISGGDTTIVARGEEGKEGTGDLSIIGSTVDAGGDVLLAANDDITLKSADETSHYRDSNENSSSGMGVTVGIGAGGINNIGVNVNTSKGEGSGSGNNSSHIETVIRGDNVEFASVDDTTIKGGQIIGDSVGGTVGGDLTIISEQDSESHDRKQSSKGGGISVGFGVGGGLANVGGSYSSQNQKGKSDYDSVDEQSGIFAGEGGFDIAVGGNTHLEGAVIDSEAAPEDNLLTTGSLTTDDIYNNSEYEASTGGWGGEFSYSKNPGQGDKNANKGSISPSLPMNENGDESSSTKSAISEGLVVITDEGAQLSKTGQTAEEVVESLNRDTDNAHEGALDRNPDLQAIFNKQAELADASAAAGKAVAKSIGDVSSMMYEKTGDEEWKEGGIYKTILQGLGAALVAELGNGQGLDAALGAMVSQLVSKDLSKLAESLSDGDPLLGNLIQNMLSNAVGLVAGGESGSSLASTMDRNNRQLHGKETRWILNNYQEFMDELNAGKEEGGEGWVDEYTAKSILAQAAARMVDEWYTKAIPYNDLYSEAEKYLLEHTSGKSFSYENNGVNYEMEFFKADDYQKENHGLGWDEKTASSWDFYDQLVSKAVDRENLPEYNDTTKHYFDMQDAMNPSKISKEMLETLRAAGYTDEQIVAKNQEMDALLNEIAKSFSGLDTIEAAHELWVMAESETDPNRKSQLQALAAIGPVVFLTDWLPTGKLSGEAGEQIGKTIGKNIGKDAADLASKAAEKNIKYISKEVVDEIAPNPIDYAKKIAASTNPSNALINEIQKNGVKVTGENVIDIRKLPDGKVVFLESGSDSSGLAHIIKNHGAEFISKGVDLQQIPELVMTAVEKGKVIGYQGSGVDMRPVYEVVFDGKNRRIAISVSNNGYVVGANLK